MAFGKRIGMILVTYMAMSMVVDDDDDDVCQERLKLKCVIYCENVYSKKSVRSLAMLAGVVAEYLYFIMVLSLNIYTHTDTCACRYSSLLKKMKAKSSG